MAVQQERAGSFEHLPDCILKLRRIVHLARRNAVAAGDPGEIRERPLPPDPQIGVAPAAVVETVFKLRDHAEVLVVQDHHLDRDLLGRDRAQFLNVHLERSVAVDIDHGRFGPGQLRPHRGRQADPHRTESAGSQQLPRPGEGVELRAPHLVLPHAGHDHRVARHPADRFDHPLRLHLARLVAVCQWMRPLPAGDAVVPFGVFAEAGSAVQPLQKLPDVGGDAEVGAHVFVDLRRVDIDVDDPGRTRKLIRIAGRTVRETGAERQQEIALVRRVIRIVAAVHAEPFQRQRMILRERADPHQTGGDRDIETLRKPGQLLRRPGGDHTAPGVNARAPRTGDRGEHRFAILLRHRRRLPYQLRRRLRAEPELQPPLLDIFGNVDPDRPGTAAVREVKRIRDGLRKFLRLHHQIAVLHDRAGHADDVGLLKRVPADQLRLHLAGDDHHRHRIHTGVGDPGQQIGRAGAAGGHADTGSAGGAGVSAGGECASLLVARQDHPDRGVRQRLMKFDRGAARIREHQFDAEALQSSDGDLSTFQKLIHIWKSFTVKLLRIKTAQSHDCTDASRKEEERGKTAKITPRRYSPDALPGDRCGRAANNDCRRRKSACKVIHCDKFHCHT